MKVPPNNPMISQGVTWIKNKLQTPEVKVAIKEALKEAAAELSQSDEISLPSDPSFHKEKPFDSKGLLKTLETAVAGQNLFETLSQWTRPQEGEPNKAAQDLIGRISTAVGSFDLGTIAAPSTLTELLTAHTSNNEPTDKFSGNWKDYEKAIQRHNQAVDDACTQPGTIEEIIARGNMVPALSEPPSLPVEQALKNWTLRFPEAGRLLTAPGVTVDPEVAKGQGEVSKVYQRLTQALEQKPEGVELHLYSGDADPFTAVTEFQWSGKGTVNEQNAMLLATLKTLYPDQDKVTEIGLPLGSLKKASTEGELAFMLARQLGNATKFGASRSPLEMETNRIQLKGPANTIKADAFAFRLLTKAGFDPTEGLNFLAKENSPEPRERLEDTDVAAQAFAAGEPDQGPRLAAGQAVVEALRRSLPEAMPGKTSEKVSPEIAKLGQMEFDQAEIEAELGQRLKGLVGEYTQELLNAPEPSQRVVSTVDKKSVVAERLNGLKGHFHSLGTAYTDNLAAIESSPLSSQEKVDTALFLLLSLATTTRSIDNKKGFFSGELQSKVKPFELSQKPMADFLNRHAKDGSWSAETFLAKFDDLASPGSAKRQFVELILSNESFQKSAESLHKKDAQWKTLYQSSASLVVAPGRYADIREKFIDKLDSINTRSTKPLDKALQQSLLAKTESQFQNQGWNYSWVLVKAKKALSTETPFSREALKALKPAEEIASKRDSEDIEIAFEDPKATERLFLAGQALTRTDDQRAVLKEQFFAAEKPALPKYPGAELERFLDSLLADPKLPAPQQHKAVRALFDLTPPTGDRERFDFNPETLKTERKIVELPHLNSLLETRSSEQLSGLVQEDLKLRDGVTVEPGTMADLFEKSHRLPSTSYIGRNPKLREKAAKAIDLNTLDDCLQVFEGVQDLETGTSRLLTEALLHQQKNGLSFDGFLDRYKSITRSGRFRGEPELRSSISGVLLDGLKKTAPGQLEKELKEDSLNSVLEVKDKAELLASLVQAKKEGSTEDLAAEVKRVEESFRLHKGKPALRKAFRELIAEKFEVQPPQLEKVFPQAANDIEQQLEHFNLEVRGLSSLVAVTREQPAEEQIKMLDYMLGRQADMPDYLAQLSKKAAEGLGMSKAPTKAASDLREALDTADAKVRSMVVASFVSGPDGLLASKEGRNAIVDKFLEPITGKRKDLARDLAETLLESQDTQAGLSVGYLYALRNEGGKPTEGQVLNRLFDSYGTPGIKLKQYLAFTSEFSKFRKDFEASQDSAMPLNYLEAVGLAHHHYGDKWRDSWKLTDILGSGSVNVAVRIFDEHSGEHRVLSLPRKNVSTNAEYDFYRVNQFVDKLLADPEKQPTFGYLRGLVDIIHDSVALEFDRVSVYRMSHGVEDFYDREVGDWNVKTVRVYSLEGKAIEMDQARGKTARKILSKDPDTYKEAMKAVAKVERDALYGMTKADQPKPTTLHANPDFHDGQVLIEPESKEVTILDFGQAVNIDNDQREYGADLLTILGGAYSPEKAAELLRKHSGVDISTEKLEEIFKSKERMDKFTKLLGNLAGLGGKVPIPVVHWVLGMNRQIALGEKTGDSMMNSLRVMALVRKSGGDIETFNALRVAGRTPLQVVGGGVMGPVGSWLKGMLWPF